MEATAPFFCAINSYRGVKYTRIHITKILIAIVNSSRVMFEYIV